MTTEELKIVEGFITDPDCALRTNELQAIVKMQYEIYKHITRPVVVLECAPPRNQT